MEVLAVQARELSRLCGEFGAKAAVLVEHSRALNELATCVGTVLDVLAVQRACLPADEVFTKDDARRVLAPPVAPAPVAPSSRSLDGRRADAGAARGGGRVESSAVSHAPATPGARKRKKATPEDEFREKLPPKYQDEASVATLLRLRAFFGARSEVGATLADVRAELGSDAPSLMACSQLLEVLLRLGVVRRESEKKGMRYFAVVAKKKRVGE